MGPVVRSLVVISSSVGIVIGGVWIYDRFIKPSGNRDTRPVMIIRAGRNSLGQPVLANDVQVVNGSDTGPLRS